MQPEIITTVVLQMARPGEILEFFKFLDAKVASGTLTRSEVDQIIAAGIGIAKEAGGPWPDENVFLPVVRHAMHVMKMKLLEMHPEFKIELNDPHLEQSP